MGLNKVSSGSARAHDYTIDPRCCSGVNTHNVPLESRVTKHMR